jgi:hypothetical protein
VVRNAGPSDAQAVTVADPTPAGLTFVSNIGACTSAYPCALGTLAAGGAATITTRYNVSPTLAGVLANIATAGSNTPDPATGNNTASANLPVAPLKTLAGTVFEDKNGDGSKTGDSGFSRPVVLTLTLTTPNGTVLVFTTATDSAGRFSFPSLPDGTFTLVIGPVDGYANTTPRIINGSVGGIGNPAPVDFGVRTASNAVVLTRFDATRSGGNVRVVWETSSEVNTLGFHIYRANGTTQTGNVLPQGATRVSPALILATGGTVPARYSYLDVTARASENYSYYLVETEVDGRELIYGPATLRAASGGGQVFLPVVAAEPAATTAAMTRAGEASWSLSALWQWLFPDATP